MKFNVGDTVKVNNTNGKILSAHMDKDGISYMVSTEEGSATRYKEKDIKTAKLQTGHGEYPLLNSLVSSNELDGLKRALEKGEDPNVQDMFGNCPIHYAADNAAYEYIELLLQFGADAKYLDNRGRTAYARLLDSEDEGIVDLNCNQSVEKSRQLLSDAIWPSNIDFEEIARQLKEISKKRQSRDESE